MISNAFVGSRVVIENKIETWILENDKIKYDISNFLRENSFIREKPQYIIQI